MRLLGPELILSTSDLTKFVRCDHASFLDYAQTTGAVPSLTRRPPSEMTGLIAAKGEEHEHAFVEELRASGEEVVSIEAEPWSAAALRRGEAATLRAMRRGAPYVYQAAFFDGRWAGYADLLERVDEPSPTLGAWSYEVVDTKLARTAKAHFVLQLSDYSHHLARLQGMAPRSMHVVLGNRERVPYLVSDYDAYYRHVRSSLERFAADPDAATPYPVEFCALCDWSTHCWQQWNAVDHLSLVANLRRTQASASSAADCPP
jgi:predicted RecB family nuclease